MSTRHALVDSCARSRNLRAAYCTPRESAYKSQKKREGGFFVDRTWQAGLNDKARRLLSPLLDRLAIVAFGR